MTNAVEFVIEVSIVAVPILFAVIAHEVMHGVVARWLGDDTAARSGRLTLNPISHIDPFGTLILPAFLLFLRLPVFGYAKPVPVNFSRLRNGRTGMIEVAAAGPLTNFTLALASAIAVRLVNPMVGRPGDHPITLPLSEMLYASVEINVVLAVFNLFPLLPLDGGRVMAGLLPLPAARVFARLEPYGFLILLLLLYTKSIYVVIVPVINAIARMLL